VSLAHGVSYGKAVAASVAHTCFLGHGAGIQLLEQEGFWGRATGEGSSSPNIANTNHYQIHWLVNE